MLTRCCPLLLLAALHAAAAHVITSSPAPVVFHRARAMAVTMAAGPAERSKAADVLEDAKNEEEEAFEADLATAAAVARGPEALAEMKAAADAAVATLRTAADAKVAAALEAGRTAKPSDKLAKALRKPSKTMALVGEGEIVDTVILGGFDLNDPAYLSEQYRTGGCAAVSVRCGGMAGSQSEDALSATTAEQAVAKGNFPGPLLAISREPFADPLQLAKAKVDGAHGVVLPLSLNGPEGTKALMSCAVELGLEPMVRVCDAEQLAAALELDAKIVVIGDCTLAEASDLLGSLPEGKAAPVTVADLPFLDVRGAWKIRDLGFNAMIAGLSMLEVCVRDRVPPAAIIKAINSKGSVKYGLGMQKGRLEGSKEFLGSMAM